MKDLHVAAAGGQRVEVSGVSGARVISAQPWRRGVKFFAVIAVLLAGCATQTLKPYRACLELPMRKRTVPAHHFGTVITARAIEQGKFQFEFVSDAEPNRVLIVTCKECMNATCLQLLPRGDQRRAPALASTEIDLGGWACIEDSTSRKTATATTR